MKLAQVVRRVIQEIGVEEKFDDITVLRNETIIKPLPLGM